MQNIYRIFIGLTLAATITGAWAGSPAARLSDGTATGGAITSGFPTVMIGGLPAARVTDTVTSPYVIPGLIPIPCPVGTIVTGSPTVLIGKLPAAHIGSHAQLVCGHQDQVITGSPTVLIN